MFGFGSKVPQVVSNDLETWMKGETLPYILDVRSLGEYRQGHIPGAQLIPLGDLPNRLHELPPDRPIVTVCRSGSRSMAAARQLVKAGYTVHNLSGGMMQWSGRVVK